MLKHLIFPKQIDNPCSRRLYRYIRRRSHQFILRRLRGIEPNLDNIYHCCTHKSASQWFKDIFSDPIVTKSSGLLPFTYQTFLPERADRRPIHERNFENLFFPKNTIITPIYSDYTKFKTINKPDNWRGFFILRDPRDLVVSWYFSVKETHPLMTDNLAKRRKELSSCSKKEGLKISIREMVQEGLFVAQRSWIQNSNKNPCVEIYRFEDLFGGNQVGYMNDLMKHLEIYLSENELKRLMEKHSFEKKKQESNHYRKGEKSDWKRHLEQEHLDLLEDLTGGILKLTDYE